MDRDVANKSYSVYKHAAGSSSARLECLLWEQEVVSSNLAYPTCEKEIESRRALYFVKVIVYKAIFIDIDDTLLDYIPCCREAFNYALGVLTTEGGLTAKRSNNAMVQKQSDLFDLFFEISGRLFSEAKHGLHTVAEVMELYPQEFIEKSGLAEGLTTNDQQHMTNSFKQAFRAAWGTTHTLVPEAKEMLDTLKNKGYRLFAASNSFGHLQRSRLEHAGILGYFEDTYISMDIGYDKPDIRFYEEALRRCGLPASEVLMIGDSMTTDVLGAQAAGMDALFFDRKKDSLLELTRHL